MKTLWVVSGGCEAIAGIRRARELGLHVVVSDGDPKAPGFALASDSVLASTYDVAATLCAARRYSREVRPVDGVLSIASDVPVTVAAVAEALSLPGISPQAARLSSDKLAMKRRFSADSVAVPEFHAVESPSHLTQRVGEMGFPLVVKPVDSRGARGVLRLTADVDLAWAFEAARAESPTGRVMLERFLPGPQISTESIVVEGVVYTPGFADRNYELLEHYAPYIIENGGTLPTRLPPSVRREVEALVARAARSMGIRNGVVKGDVVVADGRPTIIEIAARLSGGYFCTHEIPLSTGVDLLGAAMRVALGETLDPEELVPRFERGVAQRWLFPEPGLVVGIEGVSEVESRPDVALCEIRTAPGEVIPPVSSHASRPGVVIATGENAEQAERNASRAIDAIRIETR